MNVRIVSVSARAAARAAKKGDLTGLARWLTVLTRGYREHDVAVDTTLNDLANDLVAGIGKSRDAAKPRAIALFIYVHMRLYKQGKEAAVKSAQTYFEVSREYAYRMCREHPRKQFDIDGDEIELELDSPAARLAWHLLLHGPK